MTEHREPKKPTDHLPPRDEREEGDVMMICVSRCKGKELVLEL